jgi:hypothetical protein
MRQFRRLQDRCQNTTAPGGRFLREKFSSSNENPHGFGYFAPYRATGGGRALDLGLRSLGVIRALTKSTNYKGPRPKAQDLNSEFSNA